MESTVFCIKLDYVYWFVSYSLFSMEFRKRNPKIRTLVCSTGSGSTFENKTFLNSSSSSPSSVGGWYAKIFSFIVSKKEGKGVSERGRRSFPKHFLGSYLGEISFSLAHEKEEEHIFSFCGFLVRSSSSSFFFFLLMCFLILTFSFFFLPSRPHPQKRVRRSHKTGGSYFVAASLSLPPQRGGGERGRRRSERDS